MPHVPHAFSRRTSPQVGVIFIIIESCFAAGAVGPFLMDAFETLGACLRDLCLGKRFQIRCRDLDGRWITLNYESLAPPRCGC